MDIVKSLVFSPPTAKRCQYYLCSIPIEHSDLIEGQDQWSPIGRLKVECQTTPQANIQTEPETVHDDAINVIASNRQEADASIQVVAIPDLSLALWEASFPWVPLVICTTALWRYCVQAFVFATTDYFHMRTVGQQFLFYGKRPRFTWWLGNLDSHALCRSFVRTGSIRPTPW